MPNLEKDESDELKKMISLLSHNACKQILYGMVDLLVYKSSVLTKIFKMFIEDGFKYSKEK